MNVENVIKQVLNGNTEAYGRIMDLYGTELWSLAVYYVGDHSLAEDILAQAFSKAYFSLGKHAGDRDFSAWLRTITKNEAKMELRRIVREKNSVSLHSERIAAETALMRLEKDNFDSKRRFLDECIEMLPQHLRKLVERKYELQRSIKEIASEVSKTRNAVEKALAKARMQLRKCIQRKERESGNAS